MGCLLPWLPAVLTMGGLLPLLHGRVGRPALRHRPIHTGEKASEITVPSDRVPQSHICVVLEHPQGQRSTHCSLGTAVGGGTLPKVSSLSYGRVSAVGFFSMWQL